MNYAQRITTALDKEAENIAFLAYFPTAKLNTKLALLKKQMNSANKYEQTDAIVLLEIWQDQIMNAIALKEQVTLVENDLLDMNMELPELAAFEMIEKRQDILKNKLLKEEFSTNGRK